MKEYPYSSYHYFLNYKEIPECLQNAWIVQNYKEDKKAIEAFLTNTLDAGQLQELKTASSLVEAPNIDNTPKKEDLVKIFTKITELNERNCQIVKAYEKGYSQHMIAKVLSISQQSVHGVIKRNRK